MLKDELETNSNQMLELQSRLTDSERKIKSCEAERQQLQDDLDDSKDALQIETNKIQSLQQQFEKTKLENDRRLSDKDDELDIQRVAHRRQIEGLQAQFEENENKNKAEIASIRKKLTTELDDAVQQLEAAKKAKADAEITIKKLQNSIKVWYRF